MKIYSDKLTIGDLHRATDPMPAVYLNDAVLVDGRKRRFEKVTIRARTADRPAAWRELDDSANGGGPMGGHKTMPQNATYNEHGQWMARLFDIDPDARIVSEMLAEVSA